MTGRRAFACFASVQTFRYRQSSLTGRESGKSTATFTGTRLGELGCMHTFPKVSALRTPDQCSGGCGSLQRHGPTGGAPNGMPLNARTPEVSVTPEINPALVFTGSDTAASSARPQKRAASQPGSFIVVEARPSGLPYQPVPRA